MLNYNNFNINQIIGFFVSTVLKEISEIGVFNALKEIGKIRVFSNSHLLKRN